MKVDVIGSNSLLFANLPPASQVPGRTYRVSDVGPAPGILLTSNGTRYRPAGGRQLLAQRSNNPVTIQSLSGAVAETLGPFPGGLVRAGTQIVFDAAFTHNGVGSGGRTFFIVVAGQTFYNTDAITTSGSGRVNIVVNCVSDGLASHTRIARGPNSFTVGQNSQTVNLDFSQAWEVKLSLSSFSETPVNISSATWAGGIVTFNTSAAHTLAVGDKTVIASVTPTGYNGEFIVATVPTTTQFTVAMAANPGAYTSGGTSSRISNMISQSYVLELVG